MTEANQTKKFLREYEVGEKFDAFFVLRQKELLSRRDGLPYLKLEFGDRSGRMSGMVWDDADEVFHQLQEGDVIKIRGMIEMYRDTKQVAIKLMRRANANDEFDINDFLPVTDTDPEENFEKLREIADTIENEHLKQLLDNFFADDGFVAKWKRAPGGKLWHHNRIGGLVEHTISICRLCEVLAELYPRADRALLMAGAVLHDIGKIEEYSYETHLEYTKAGRLIGHIVLGAEWVRAKADAIEGFPRELADRIVHLVLSHQDEFGSPVLPSMREAFLLHYADQIDSKMDALNRIADGLNENETMTYVRLLGRQIDFGPEIDKSLGE